MVPIEFPFWVQFPLINNHPIKYIIGAKRWYR